MCVQWRRRERKKKWRFVSTLINPFRVRFVSSHSALDRVFTAHSSNKAFSSCLVGRHRFILCVRYVVPCPQAPGGSPWTAIHCPKVFSAGGKPRGVSKEGLREERLERNVKVMWRCLALNSLRENWLLLRQCRTKTANEGNCGMQASFCSSPSSETEVNGDCSNPTTAAQPPWL